MTAQTQTQPKRTKAKPKPRWLSVVDVAREWDISRQTVYNLCETGRLPFYTAPTGRRRFLRDEIAPIMAPYRTPVTNPDSRLPDPLGGLEGPVVTES